MRNKSLTPEAMEDRVARFNKLQTYQRQNFEAHSFRRRRPECRTLSWRFARIALPNKL
jgi:hypothetical protein